MDTTVKYMVPWTLFLSSIGDTVWTTDFGFGLAEKNGPILDMVKVDAGEYLLAGARLYDFELMNLNGLLMRLSFNPTSTNITSELPTKYSLQQNYPNPFNPTTTISYALPEQSTVKLTVFDIRGQEVMELDRAEKQAGNYEVQWSGMDQSGNSVSTGVFFARLQAGEFTQTIKMVYLK